MLPRGEKGGRIEIGDVSLQSRKFKERRIKVQKKRPWVVVQIEPIS